MRAVPVACRPGLAADPNQLCAPGYHCPTIDQQIECPAGSYCGGGKKHSCPPGTYGNSTGLSDRACSGPCPSGYFCTGNTVNPSICGRGNFCPRGSSKPIKVPSGYYSISVAKANTVVADGVVVHISNAHESLLCEPGHYCAAGIRHQCPGGTYGKEPGLTTPSCSGVCSGGYLCMQVHSI